mgnify:FL=1|tara:strand:- start:255 stop:545 length:291 start_codon:yes stop_codon:yes gene_type:complete
MFSQSSFADESEMVCELRPTKHIKDLEKEITKQGCVKGDILLIRDMKVTARYLRAAAHACDFNRPFAVPSDNSVFICHYQGFLRQERNPNYSGGIK